MRVLSGESLLDKRWGKTIFLLDMPAAVLLLALSPRTGGPDDALLVHSPPPCEHSLEA